jgi:hypothetical protein
MAADERAAAPASRERSAPDDDRIITFDASETGTPRSKSRENIDFRQLQAYV